MPSVLLALLMAVPALPAAGAGLAPRPNVVFILADDLGWGDLGCYGQRKIRTPRLDRLAADGMRFTQCYAGSTVCAPSRAALLTGLHTGHTRIRGNGPVFLTGRDTTVAALLKRAGYATAAVGKWGLGDPGTDGLPGDHGFDRFFGYLNHTHAHDYYPDHLWRQSGNAPPERVPLPNVQDKGVANGRVEYSADRLVREAVDWLGANRDRPFFLYYAPTLPHANNERQRADGHGNEVPDYEPYSVEPWPDAEKGKAAMITRLDAGIGRILDKLDDLGLRDDTLVVFTSDNGPHKEGGNDPAFFASAGPFRGIKRDLTEGGIRVPGIARWPGVIPPGAVSDHVWAFWDVPPTLCELAGVPPPDGLDGVSFAPTLTGRGQQRRPDFLYWEFHERGFSQAVRHGNWKALRLSPGRPLQLYDLSSDPGEARDVAADNPEVVARIEAYLLDARTPSVEFPVRLPKRR